jgi:small-conductance mechanosensitive channel
MLLGKIISALVVLVVVVISIDGWAAPQSEMTPPSGQGTGATTQNGLPEHLTVDQARELVARMSDREVRELLLKQVETLQGEIQPTRAEPVSMFFNVQENMYVMRNRLRETLAAVPELPSIGPFIVMRITKGYEPSHIWAIGFYVLLIFAGALAGEAIFRRMFQPFVSQSSRLVAQSEFGKLGILLVRALIQLLAVSAFAGIAGLLFLFIYKGHEAARIAFWSIFFLVFLVRVSAIVLGVILAPRRPALRLPDVDNEAARHLYWSFLFLIGLSVGSAIIGNFLEHIGVIPDQLHAAGLLLLIFNVIAIIAVVWTQRSEIARLLGANSAGTTATGGRIGALFGRYWHVFAVTYVVAMGVLATVHRLLTGEVQGARIFPTLAVLIAVPLIDGLLRMIVLQFFGARNGNRSRLLDGTRTDDPPPSGPRLENSSPEVGQSVARPDDRTNDGTDYGRVMLRNGRILLALVSVFLLADIWDIQLQDMAAHGMGARVAGSLFDIVVTLILASATWGIVKTAINRQLPHEGLGALALADGETGGTGLSRVETLLPLLRKFLYIALIVIVAMIVISSLGINIGPLLAGAGVIGIALGFGAQTLVRDVISGIFFLIDDAFRVGEYIDVGEGKGTVERMSVRSLMLRHHLGQINTIPFGAIRRVTNYSRDWVIMKLEMRVPFETDLEKLRKLVKRVGVELMADPIYGPNFIQPVKSQGVHHMDDSSFIIRVKFMAKPGEQFVLRREIFRRLQEAFQANGIKFAPRRVIVDAGAVPDGAAAAVANDETLRAAPGT